MLPTLLSMFRTCWKSLILADVLVEGGSKRRRRGSVGAVEFGSAHGFITAKWQDTRRQPRSCPALQEAQECEPTWSFGKRSVGWC